MSKELYEYEEKVGDVSVKYSTTDLEFYKDIVKSREISISGADRGDPKGMFKEWNPERDTKIEQFPDHIFEGEGSVWVAQIVSFGVTTEAFVSTEQEAKDHITNTRWVWEQLGQPDAVEDEVIYKIRNAQIKAPFVSVGGSIVDFSSFIGGVQVEDGDS